MQTGDHHGIHSLHL